MEQKDKNINIKDAPALLEEKIIEAVERKDWNLIKTLISNLEPQDVVDLFKQIDIKERIILFRLLPTEIQSQVFSELDSNTQKDLLTSLSDEYIKSIILELDPDDRTQLFEEMPPDLTRRLLNLLPPKDRREVLQLLGYPEDSVGRLMTPDYVAVKSYWTVGRSIRHIRRWGKDAETIDVVYVVDNKWHLLDEIPIRKLIIADPQQTIESLMDHRFVSISAYADQEEAVKLIQKYNLVALPVVDQEGHLLGIVTVDDVIDVLREEQTEDFTKFSAIEAKTVGLDIIANVKEVPFAKIFRSRITWLVTLLVMDLITGGIINSFEEMIGKYVVLVTFLPVLVDTAGNAGSQSATLIIRAMALGMVELKDWLYLLAKEVVTSAALGLAMGVGISFAGVIRSGSLKIASVVVLAMIVNVIIGSLIGVALPFIFTRFKKDPATASTPLITTLADIVGTTTYLTLAYIILS